jgi:hypothetical protein
VVRDDHGGQIPAYERKRERLAAADSVALCGNIRSAATIFVSLPNACACPDAVFGFHGARMGLHPSPGGTATIASHYPPPLRDWYQANAAHLYWPQDYATLTAGELAAMGEVTLCAA